MASNENLSTPEKRLSLDLPEDYHQMIDEIGRTMGFSSKNEVVRNVLQFYDQAMGCALDGLEIMVYDRKNNRYAPIYSALSTLVRRRREQVGQSVQPQEVHATPPPGRQVA